MRGVVFFLAGLLAGTVIMQPSRAQRLDAVGNLKLNHVGITAKDIGETIDFYTKTMGFREAFTLRGPDGKPSLSYIQISRDTFLEIAPASADRPTGLTHFGLEATDVSAAVKKLREEGVKIDDPRVSRTQTLLTSVIDPNGVRFEIAQLPPTSLPRKAIESWK